MKIHEKINLHTLDYVVIALYLFVVLAMGFLFWAKDKYGKKKITKDKAKHFFTGGGRNSTFVVGMSLFATISSSLFFLNNPGQVVISRWMWMGAQFAILAIIPLVSIYIVPFYRRMKESTAYSYLENRFHYSLRALSSISFIIFQIFRVAVVLYVPTLGLSLIIDINPIVILIFIGLTITITSAFGGFKAVIWTDTMQGIVMLFGTVLILILAIFSIDWGSSTFVSHQIFDKASVKPDLINAGFFLIFVYNLINAAYAYMGSQDVTQRYKGTNSLKQIKKTLWTAFGISLFSAFLFFGVASLIYMFFSSKGYYLDGAANSIQAIAGKGAKGAQYFSYFIASSLPIGIVGLLIASVFAAGQSTVSSGLSSLSNSIIVDFVIRFKKLNDKTTTILSKAFVGIFGILGTAFGIVLIVTNQDGLFNYFAGIIAVLNAPTIAIFLLGIFTKRTNWIGALTGFTLASILGVFLWIFSQKFIPDDLRIKIHSAITTMINFGVAIVFGYVVSIIVDKFKISYVKHNLTNKTFWTRTEEFKKINDIESEYEEVLAKSTKKGFKQWDLLERLEKEKNDLEKIVDSQTFYSTSSTV
ncbi:sodium:solute symporter family transporter [Mycoplasmopsis cricetuli]|uniref:sodium:solute symporter family transporter n=1 Tax=Mycoplasmopsis cricetuli TaxID=171283 RepID=UPI00046ECD20|nr:hypothetical protein [Mycoplasmopsis cricetuli]